MRKPFVSLLLFLAVLGCTTQAPRAVAPPVHEADLYPESQTIAGLTVALNEVTDPERMRRYFGRDLTADQILPVMIIVTNRGEDTFTVKPSDVLVYEGKTIVDPVPLPKGAVGPDPFKETAVAPGSTYQGILFYKVRKSEAGLYGKVERVFSDKLMLRMIATDRDSGERIDFGPFTLAGL